MASIINASTTAGLVNTADTSGILQLQTANTTAVTVDASQNVTVVGSLTAAGLSGPHNGTVGATTPSTVVATTVKASTTMGVGGATPSASGSGISFPATQSASSDANTLDDYEEGSWTPAITCDTVGNLVVTAGGQVSGTYTKIGRVVNVNFIAQAATFTHSTASGNVRITGLPFNVGSVEYAGVLSSCNLINKSGYTQFNVRGTGTTMIFKALGNNIADANVQITDLPSGSSKDFYGSLTYDV